MDVVGSATAVLAVVQVGLSLAKALRESFKDYKDAKDDLISLAETTESTLVLVAKLEILIRDNDQTKTFSGGGVAIVTKYHRDAGRIVEDLVELLTRTGVTKNAGGKIEAKDSEVSRFTRVNWLGRKPRVKEKQEDLQTVRIENCPHRGNDSFALQRCSTS